MASLLDRAATLLRLPGAHAAPIPTADGRALRCPDTGRVVALHDGVIDLLGDAFAPTLTQRSLDTALTSWLYDRLRDPLTWMFGMPPFPAEFDAFARAQGVEPGDVVLDIACGPGNFTVEWARCVGPDGLVVGLDISAAMLARAAKRVAEVGLANVLLLRADAQALPFADATLRHVSCAGGLHQLPDLPRALAEMARVSRDGGVLTASTFIEPRGALAARVAAWTKRRLALHLIPLPQLRAGLEAAGFAEPREVYAGWGFACVTGRRAAAPGT